MRVPRLVIVGLSGLVAMHIFMLAGHGHGHDPLADMRGVTAHPSTATSAPSLTTTAGEQGDTGMHPDMTVACLAVVAGLLLLQPKQRRQPMPMGADERTPSWYPARVDLGRPRTRSLEELCISLT
jgi:hypothetical protein